MFLFRRNLYMTTIGKLEQKYRELCNKPSDINEHLPTIFYYSTKCKSIIELGVRGAISTYAMLYGLAINTNNNKKLLLNDIESCDISLALELSNGLDIKVEYQWISDLDMELSENYDMTFIDTLHVYGQLKRELNKYSKITNKYIIMHDTTVDEQYGEIVRSHTYEDVVVREALRMSELINIPPNELVVGLWPAIEEFLYHNPNWTLLERYTNNNGLTILKRND